MVDGVYKEIDEPMIFDNYGFSDEITLEKRIENLEALADELAEEIELLKEGR